MQCRKDSTPQLRRETAALRHFGPAYDGFGSKAVVRATLASSLLCPPKRKSEASSVTSEMCQQRSLPPFAERDLWNICSGSLGLDACELHHLAPLLGFLSDQLAEVSGRARKHRAAEISEPHFHVGVVKARVSFRVELVNNLRRCVFGRADARPPARLVARHKFRRRSGCLATPPSASRSSQRAGAACQP